MTRDQLSGPRGLCWVPICAILYVLIAYAVAAGVSHG